MTDHILSPDGKFMWTGSEWIPTPPAATHEIPPMVDLDPPPASQSTDERDSVVKGGVNSNISTTAPPSFATYSADQLKPAIGYRALIQGQVDQFKAGGLSDREIKEIDLAQAKNKPLLQGGGIFARLQRKVK